MRVSLDGAVLADSHRAVVLYETGLPPRWYLPPEDVREDVLRPTDTRTGCAYKGFASYWSVTAPGGDGKDVVWAYPEPRREADRIAGYMCFFNERVDVEIDGELQERPQTQWSPHRSR